jgi:hypothetical protein
MPEISRQIWLASPMMRGDDVLAVQERLRAAGAAIEPDGLYGRATRNAVVDFQKRCGLEADGIVGQATWGRLFQPADAPATSLPLMDANSLLTRTVLDDLAKPHQRYKDSCLWHLTAEGVRIQMPGDGPADDTPSDAERALVSGVMQRFAQPLASVLSAQLTNVPIELIVACICAESNGNPSALRREPGCDTSNPERTPSRVSLGLMQTLLSTARTALGDAAMPLQSLADPQKSIAAGAAYIFLQARQTHFDPPLVAAAYNSGGLYYEGTPANRWRLRQYPIGTPNHVNRFTRYFNGAIAALDLAALPATVPSFKRMLAT